MSAGEPVDAGGTAFPGCSGTGSKACATGGPRQTWIVSELYYPELTSTGYFMTEIAEGLARRRAVGVLCSQPTYASRGVRAPRRERRNGVEVHRCAGATFDKDVLALRLVNLLTISASVFLEAMRRFRPGDAVLAVTNPPLLPLLMALACRLRRCRFVLVVHDAYPEVLVAAGMVRPGSLLHRLVGWVFRRLCRGADRVVVLGRDAADLIAAKLGGRRDRIAVIPHWGDVRNVVPTDRRASPLLRRLGLLDKFVVQYSGNLGRTHDLESLLACAEQLRHLRDVAFVVIGFGAKKAWFAEQVARCELDNVFVLPRHPQEKLSESLGACDLAVIPMVRGMAGVSVPSRMYNVLASGRPILAAADEASELARVVREERVGWVTPPGDPALLAQAVLQARADRERLAEMGRRARQAAESKCTAERAVRAYDSLLEGLTDVRR